MSAVKEFYSKTIKETLKELNTSINGLSEIEAQKRLKKFGPNKIVEEKKVSLLKMFLRQFNSILIWILLLITN